MGYHSYVTVVMFNVDSTESRHKLWHWTDRQTPSARCQTQHSMHSHTGNWLVPCEIVAEEEYDLYQGLYTGENMAQDGII